MLELSRYRRPVQEIFLPLNTSKFLAQPALILRQSTVPEGTRGGAVGYGTALQQGKFAGSIPGGVIGIFHWHNPSGNKRALDLTQPLTEMSTRNISWVVKAAGA